MPLTPNESNASDISHAPEVLALGPTVLRLSRVIRLRPRSASDAFTLSKVLALGPIFNSLDPFDSDQGPTPMLLINLKVLAFGGGATFDSFGPLNSGQGPNLMTVMHLKSWPVADFKVIRFIKCIRFRGPGGAWWSLNLKSWGPLSMHWIQ